MKWRGDFANRGSITWSTLSEVNGVLVDEEARKDKELGGEFTEVHVSLVDGFPPRLDRKKEAIRGVEPAALEQKEITDNNIEIKGILSERSIQARFAEVTQVSRVVEVEGITLIVSEDSWQDWILGQLYASRVFF
jgi:hypothetical protein